MRVDAAPWVALGAAVLAVLPLLWAGAEKEIVPASSTEMVDRFVPSTVTYVQLTGMAVPVALAAPGSTVLPPYGVLVRDTPASDSTTIVMSATSPLDGLSRTVVGRVVQRTTGADAAEALAARGEATTGLDGGLVVAELPAPDDVPILELSGAAEVGSVAEGTLVELEVTFAGESLPTCTLADAGCAPRVLAAGDGIYFHLARGTGDGQPILVQTTYPSSVVPGSWTGTQVRNRADLEAFAATLPVKVLAGWGRVLVLVSIADDPTLVRDRLWLGPAVLGLVAGLLWLGERIGYPYFRPGLEQRRRWASGREAVAAELPRNGLTVRLSGHARTMAGQRRYLDDMAARLVPSDGAGGTTGGSAGRAPIVVALADGSEIPLAANDLGALGGIERGEVISLRGRRPALWAHWFGTDLRLTFDSTEDRDLAAQAIATAGPPVRSSP